MVTLKSATKIALHDLKDLLQDDPDGDMEEAIEALAKQAIPHSISGLLSFLEATAEGCVRENLTRYWRSQQGQCEKAA